MSTPTLLVTGANGKLGRHAVELLLKAGRGRIVAASRDPGAIADLGAKGAEVRRADFDDEAGLATAFAGVDRILLISTSAVDPATRVRQHLAAVAAAKAAGVKEIVYTSLPKPVESAVTFAHVHADTEAAIVASGLAYTFLRNTWYQQNLLLSLPQAFASGRLYSSAGEGRVAHVAHADCARAAAAALARESTNEVLTITGPELLTTRQIAALASEIVGKPLEVIDVTDEQLAGGMIAAGVPEGLVPMLVSFDRNIRQGGLDVMTDAVERLTGRAPTPLREYLAANTASFGG